MSRAKSHLFVTPIPIRAGETLEERILNACSPEPNTGCWLWSNASTNGYGTISFNNKHQYAHRASYEAFVGPIPEGLHIDHLCRVRSCVNPAHLEPVTQRENALRGISPAALNAKLTHCSRGHEFNEENTWREPNGKRHLSAMLGHQQGGLVSKDRHNSPISQESIMKRLHLLDSDEPITEGHITANCGATVANAVAVAQNDWSVGECIVMLDSPRICSKCFTEATKPKAHRYTYILRNGQEAKLEGNDAD